MLDLLFKWAHHEVNKELNEQYRSQYMKDIDFDDYEVLDSYAESFSVSYDEDEERYFLYTKHKYHDHHGNLVPNSEFKTIFIGRDPMTKKNKYLLRFQDRSREADLVLVTNKRGSILLRKGKRPGSFYFNPKPGEFEYDYFKRKFMPSIYRASGLYPGIVAFTITKYAEL